MKKLSTVHEVIEALGGDQRAGALVGSGLKAVGVWKWKRKFPAKTYLAFISELAKLGLYAEASLWSFSSIEDNVDENSTI